MSDVSVVVLAAGKGTRMYSKMPKVLHKLAGKALVQHVLDAANALNPQQLCVVYGHGGEAVPLALANSQAQFALQEPQLGTGHAVQQAMPHLPESGRVLVLYGDVPLTREQTLHKMLLAGEGLILLTVFMDNPTGYGRIVRGIDNKVLMIVEEKDATAEQRLINEVNTGILLAPSVALRKWLSQLGNNNAQGEYYLTDIVAMAVEDGIEITTVQPEFDWETHGINNKQQLANLERIKQSEQAKALLQQGVGLADPARIDIRGDLQCGQDVLIDVGCVFEGQVTLADEVEIGPYCVIKNAHIAAGSKIAAYSHIEETQVGAACFIGPYARLRPGTQLADQVHIGNFVEIKNSQIAQASKANHLSYIGDSTVGSRVNIGAGTITCNYDGANKFRTIIEDDVFVGSDSQLVAPVTISAGSTIGAGSTITKDTPAGELTLSRSKQFTVPGWKRPVKQKK